MAPRTLIEKLRASQASDDEGDDGFASNAANALPKAEVAAIRARFRDFESSPRSRPSRRCDPPPPVA